MNRPLGKVAKPSRQWHAVAVFEPLAESVLAARRFVAGCLSDQALRENGELLVSELATNAIRYASGPFEVRVLDGPRPRVEVRDHSQELPTPLEPRPDAEGGRGLFIVGQLARAWGVEGTPTGKAVWFEL